MIQYKHLLIIPVFLMGFSACSSNHNSSLALKEQVAADKIIQPEKKKRKHKAQIQGVISVDIVNDNNRLHLLTGKQNQGITTLWYQFSDDEGKNWSSAVNVLHNQTVLAKISRGNDAQIAAQGKNIVITWTKFDKTARFNAGPMLSARSTDAGQSWAYSAIPPDWKKGPHGYIDLAADEHAMHAVWLDRRFPTSVNAAQGLRYSRSIDGGLSWQTNTTLDALACSCCWNTIKTDEKGDAYVLYRDKQPSDLSIGVINSQQQWQHLNHVGAFNWQFDGCPHIGGGIDFQTTQGKKRIHAVVGTGHQEHLGIHYLHSDDAGKNWSPATKLGNESAIHSDIASHNNARVAIVWDMMSENGLGVFVADSLDRGNHWSEPRQLSKTGMRATHPKIVKTKNGFFAVWTESDGHQQLLATKRL